jgi:PAS domain-containing protein
VAGTQGFEVDVDGFARQLAAVEERVVAARLRAADPAVTPDEVIPALLEALESAVGQLRCAADALRELRQARAVREFAEIEGERGRQLFERAPVPVVVTDLDGTIRELNRAAAEFLGPHDGNPLGGCLTDYVARADRSAFAGELTGLRWIDRAWRPRVLRVRLHQPGQAARRMTLSVAAADDETLVWVLGIEGDALAPAEQPGATVERMREVHDTRDLTQHVDVDLMPVVGAVGMCLRHPDLPPDLRVALGQAAIALDGAVQWMAKLQQAVSRSA